MKPTVSFDDDLRAKLEQNAAFRREWERLAPLYEGLARMVREGRKRTWIYWRWWWIGDALNWPQWWMRLGERRGWLTLEAGGQWRLYP